MESPRLLGLLPLVFLSCGSLTEPADPAGARAGTSRAGTSPELPVNEEPLRRQGDPAEVAERAKAAIDEGEIARARALLGGLLVDRWVDQARALLRDDRPEEALVWLDEALELAPADREVLVLHGEGSLAIGQNLGDPLFFEDALRSFRAAGRDPEALLGASRAARMLFRTEEALELAEAGVASIGDAGRSLLTPEAPERTLAQAAFDAYIARKSTVDAAEDPAAAEARAQELFRKTEQALDKLESRHGDDPWVWTNLSNLYLWEGRLLEARQAIERGLESLPASPELHERLYQVSRQEGGDTAVVEAFDAYSGRHPEIALGWWYGARARFDRAVDNLEDRPREELRAAGEMFARCRRLEPAYEADCLGYEVMVQNALGWCDYHEDDLEGAVAAFRATEEVLEGGLQWEIEGRLPSGVSGLFFVANAYNEQGRFAEAADVFDFLRAYEPDNPDWANNAGFFHRDAGTALSETADALRRAAAGEVADEGRLAELRERAGVDPEDLGTERERELLAAAAERLDALAKEQYRKSYDAYVQASHLAPDDVRVVNDTALIQVYHLREELEEAERMLLRCVELGAEQMQSAEELSEDQLFELENAWGDAYQNLGVLYLEVEDDPARALPFFEQAAEIGPEPRPQVTQYYVPLCRRRIAAETPGPPEGSGADGGRGAGSAPPPAEEPAEEPSDAPGEDAGDAPADAGGDAGEPAEAEDGPADGAGGGSRAA